MKINFFFLTALFCCAFVSPGIAQQEINFSTIDPLEVICDEDKVEIRRVDDVFGEAAYLFQDGSEFVIKTSDIERISFWYSLPRMGDNCRLILESRRNDLPGDGWQIIKSLPHVGTEIKDKFTFTESVSNSAKSIGDISLRFRLAYPDFEGNGAIFIDSISITKLSPKKRQELKEQEDKKARIAEVEEKFKKYGEDNCKSVQEQYHRIQESYIQGFYEIKAIAYRTKVIEIIGELSRYNQSRSQMGNPIAYKEFENILDSVIMRSDNMVKSILKDYKAQLKKIDISKNTSPTSGKKNVFSKVYSVLSNVVNVVSAGRIDNIMNSVKSIFATIFSRPALEEKYPIRDWVYNKKNKLEKVVDNEKHINIIKAEINKGIRFLAKINNFVDITKNENENFLSELIKTTEITAEAAELSADADKLIQKYFSDINIVLTTDYIHEELNKVNNKPTEKLKGQIEDYFKSVAPKCQSVNGLNFYQVDIVRMEALNSNVAAISMLYDRYIKLTDDLKDHYRTLERSLEDRKNPFAESENVDSFNRYEELKSASLQALDNLNQLFMEIFPNEGK